MEQLQYKFSVIIVIDKHIDNIVFLEESIASVTDQTVEHTCIQLILADLTGSETVQEWCRAYEKQDPSNVVWLNLKPDNLQPEKSDKENNPAEMILDCLQGAYVTFLAAGDKWSRTAFAEADLFYEKHKKIDVLSCRCGEEQAGGGCTYLLDYKFEQQETIDIMQRPDCIQPNAEGIFIRKTAIDDERGLLPDSGKSSQCFFITALILNKMRYGVLPSAIYYRTEGGGGLQLCAVSSELNGRCREAEAWKELFDRSEERSQDVIPYVQYTVLYGILQSMKTRISGRLSEEQRSGYKSQVIALLETIDDRIIWDRRFGYYAYQLYALKLKYGEDVLEKAELKKGKMVYRGMRLLNVKGQGKLKINVLQIEGERLILQGLTSLTRLGERCRIYITSNRGLYQRLKLHRLSYGHKFAFNREPVFENQGFELELPINEGTYFSFVAEIDGKKVKLDPSFQAFGKLNGDLPHTYYAHAKYLIKYENHRIKCLRRRPTTHLMAELRYLGDLLKRRKGRIALCRCAYYWERLFTRKPIWLISDRTDMAGDNGEQFFRYMNRIKEKNNYQLYFVLSETCRDFSRLKQYGKVLSLESAKYKRKFLLADKILSSQAGQLIQNAFGDDKDYLQDLFDFDFVFLQHGIIKDDFSAWLHKQKYNIKTFVTSTEAERSSIIHGGYGYTEHDVVLTGLPRFDALENHAKKEIVICPTWRKKLAGPLLPGSSERPYQDGFKYSSYFDFYNRLINDPELLTALQKYGYTASFYIHPCFKKQAADFHANERIQVIGEDIDYSRIFSEGALMVTDYSSVYFDFAYLKKPIVYAMFDYEDYYQSHTCKRGYFDYETDGFGVCCYDYPSTIKAIIRSVANECEMEEKYKERVERFFAWTDHDNCKRVLEAVKSSS